MLSQENNYFNTIVKSPIFFKRNHELVPCCLFIVLKHRLSQNKKGTNFRFPIINIIMFLSYLQSSIGNHGRITFTQLLLNKMPYNTLYVSKILFSQTGKL